MNATTVTQYLVREACRFRSRGKYGEGRILLVAASVIADVVEAIEFDQLKVAIYSVLAYERGQDWDRLDAAALRLEGGSL